MPFATPLALLGLLFVPAVIAMYLLKLRRDEAVVPSTLLWTRLVADVEANAPWQKLRRSLLLLLQLLLVIILAALAARPFLERPAGLARDLDDMITRGASVHLVFSENDPGHAAVSTEIGSRLDALLNKGLVMKVFAKADHNFHEMSSRAEMLAWVETIISRTARE